MKKTEFQKFIGKKAYSSLLNEEIIIKEIDENGIVTKVEAKGIDYTIEADIVVVYGCFKKIWSFFKDLF